MKKKKKLRLIKFKPTISFHDSEDDSFREKDATELFEEDPFGIEKESEVFSEESKITLNDLKIVKNLGQGEFGKVYKVILKKNPKKQWAMKRLKLESDPSRKRAVEMEMRLLKKINNPYVISLDGFFFVESYFHVLLEYMNCGSIGSLMSIVKNFPEPVIAQMATQIFKGLEYLHEKKNIIHRDIKPQNILVNHLGEVKLCDFGMGNMTEIKKRSLFNTFQGDLNYMSPERIKGCSHSFDCDLWSVGVVLAEMALGRFPYPLNTKNNLFEMMNMVDKITVKGILEKEGNFSDDFVDLVGRLCHQDPQKRPSARECLLHNFIRKYKDHHPSFRGWLNDNYIEVRKKLYLEKRKKQ